MEEKRESKFYLSKHKYLEMYHYSAQYYDYAARLASLDRDDVKARGARVLKSSKTRPISDSVAELAIERATVASKMELIEDCVKEAIFGKMEYYIYIFRCVTEELTYEKLEEEMGLSKDIDKNTFGYYRMRYYWLLAKER